MIFDIMTEYYIKNKVENRQKANKLVDSIDKNKRQHIIEFNKLHKIQIYEQLEKDRIAMATKVNQAIEFIRSNSIPDLSSD